jgi:hypothetical protein
MSEIIFLMNFLNERLFTDEIIPTKDEPFNDENKLIQKLKTISKYGMEEDLNVLLKNVETIYNSFAFEIDTEDKELRSNAILNNTEFQREVNLACEEFGLNVRLKQLDSKNNARDLTGKKANKYEEVLDTIDYYIKSREVYGEVSKKRGKRKNYKENKKRLEIIKAEYESLKEDYSKILEYKEKVLKGTSNKKDLEITLKDFENKIELCLIRLENVSSSYSFDEYINLDTIRLIDSSRKGIREEDANASIDNLKKYQGMNVDIYIYRENFDKFRSSHKGLESILATETVLESEQELTKKVQKLQADMPKIKENTDALLESNKKGLERLNNNNALTEENLHQFLDSSIRALELQREAVYTIYAQSGSFTFLKHMDPKERQQLEEVLKNVYIKDKEVNLSDDLVLIDKDSFITSFLSASKAVFEENVSEYYESENLSFERQQFTQYLFSANQFRNFCRKPS